MSLPIQQIFRATCQDCGQISEQETYIDARNWLSNHHKKCEPFKNRIEELKFNFIKKKQPNKIYSNGHIMVEVVCPICNQARMIQDVAYKTSIERNKNTPENIGICRVCRMSVIKPATGHMRYS